MTIHPGAGGTESQNGRISDAYVFALMETQWDGADVLVFSMVKKLGSRKLNIEVKGRYAYGYLKPKRNHPPGAHFTIRRQPSSPYFLRFGFVYPAIEDDISVEINQDDLRIDTFRASGAGGQHVNKTSSAVRITHIPTGIVVQCQNERCQFKNKDRAMKILRARLYQLKKEEKNKEKMEIEKNKKDISWGNQIRSYVFQPYTLVKDHRTKYETGNIQAVMDGEIDEFLRQYLLFNVKK